MKNLKLTKEDRHFIRTLKEKLQNAQYDFEMQEILKKGNHVINEMGTLLVVEQTLKHNDSIVAYLPVFNKGKNLNEASRKSLNRILDALNSRSYCIISSSDPQLETGLWKKKGKNYNRIRFATLKSILKQEGFSFIPVKGRYVYEVTGEEVYEDSLIVFPYMEHEVASPSEFDRLYDLILKLVQFDPEVQDKEGKFYDYADPSDANTFGQESFIAKREGEPAKLIPRSDKDVNGNLTTIKRFKGTDGNVDIAVNEETAIDMFTQLVKNKGTNNGRFGFTLVECYMKDGTRSMYDAMLRFKPFGEMTYR